MLQNIHIVAYEQDLFDKACENIFRRHTNLLPDLRSITIFLPNHLSQKRFREKLMQHATKHNCNAVLSPQLTTLRSWALSQHTTKKQLLSQYARELILVDAIKKQPSIFFQANPWVIANELLSFFDAMQLNNIQLDNLYNCTAHHDSNDIESENSSYALSQETKLVTTLWHAWKEQITDEFFTDPTQAYTDVINSLDILKQDIYYIVGIEKLCVNEISILNKMENQSHLYTLFHASHLGLCTKSDEAIIKLIDKNTKIHLSNDDNVSSYSKFLDSVYLINDLSLKERASAFRQSCPISPIKNRIKLFKANTFEQHVCAIDIKIRSHLLAKKKNIGVITSDRKLARRLRAILEHANIQVNDLGGWALATTSTVVVIENWLQLIEDGFSATSLLALLKSPFFPIKVDQTLHNKAVIFFEKEIILASKLHRGLHTYRVKLEQHQSQSNEIEIELYEYLYGLIDQLETSTLALIKLQKSNNISLQQFFITLVNSLKTSGIYTTLNSDTAGKQLLNLFETQISQLKIIENDLNWSECRRFLARILDQQNFKPATVDSNVTFCSLEQSRLLKFDALIIASVNKDQFPGTSNNYIFFNESIRKELNISTWRDESAIHLHQFRCLLESAEDLMITTETERDGEQIRSSPWLEIIESFHNLAYGEDLLDKEIIQLLNNEDAIIEEPQIIPMPKLASQPSPLLHENNKPKTISISQYQQLITCPYQFFAKTCLNLSKTEELQEDLEKNDFGSLVHECIRAFFENRPSLPGPFKQRVNVNNLPDAESLLNEISNAVFKQDTQANFNNKIWLHRWKNLIPKFLDWEIKRENVFTPKIHEHSVQLAISDELTLKGQIDRIDSYDETYAIIDYKTGSIPSRKSVLAGEKVQLPSYALLSKYCTQVEFVNIGKDNTVKSEAIIKDEDLHNLVEQHHVRLKDFSKQLSKVIQLAALSNDENCDWCEAKGLCRKDYWQA